MEYLNCVNCLVLGDGAVGKTTFLIKYCSDLFVSDYCPTLNDFHEKIICHKNKKLKLCFNDITGQDNYDFYRKGVYNNIEHDIVILMFALNERFSFNNIIKKWISEIESVNLKSKSILVGSKYDLRNSKNSNHIKYREGSELAKKISLPYIEISSYTNYGIDNLINIILQIWTREQSLLRSKNKNKKCIIF